MTTPRSPKQHTRPSLPMIAATTAALPAVVLSSLAIAQPAAAESRPRTVPATLAAAIQAQEAAIKAGVIPAASVSTALPASLRPAQPSAPAEYTIARGDTISGIAGRYGLDTNAILKLNNLQPNTIIYPGQKIKLTGSAPAPPLRRQSRRLPPLPPQPAMSTPLSPATHWAPSRHGTASSCPRC